MSAEGGYGVTYGKMQNRVNIGLDFFGCSVGPSMKLDRAYIDPLTNEWTIPEEEISKRLDLR